MAAKRAKTLKLPEETIQLIEELAAREHVTQQTIVSRAIWYYTTLEGPDGRLAIALEKVLMEKIPAMVDQKIAIQNTALEIMLESLENRIVDRLSNRKP